MQSSHILSRVAATILCAAGIASSAYTLQDEYTATNFFDEFSFFSGNDPTNGFVKYTTLNAANTSSLAGVLDGSIYMGVDSETVNPPAPGRQSVRVSSNKLYNSGSLFLADITHMPDSECGVWPAFWTLGDDPWPANGEIDIIEGANDQVSNIATLHTSSGCSLVQQAGATGKQDKTDCNTDQGKQGCSIADSAPNSYGSGFNSIGGGVYAMEWTSTDIKVTFFPRAAIPADIASGKPDPSTWPAPMAHFGGSGCNINQHFKSHRIIFDTTFCGDWAGRQSVWDASSCAKKAPTCTEYVAKNPQAFATAFWQVGSIKVFSGAPPKRDTVGYKPRGSRR